MIRSRPHCLQRLSTDRRWCRQSALYPFISYWGI
ncbi:hypothetical protein EMIT0158MI4_200123 [Burkholderia ambifaria]